MRWVVKRKFPESVLGLYGTEEEAQVALRSLITRYQSSNYTAEPYDDKRVFDWVSKALLGGTTTVTEERNNTNGLQ